MWLSHKVLLTAINSIKSVKKIPPYCCYISSIRNVQGIPGVTSPTCLLIFSSVSNFLHFLKTLVTWIRCGCIGNKSCLTTRLLSCGLHTLERIIVVLLHSKSKEILNNLLWQLCILVWWGCGRRKWRPSSPRFIVEHRSKICLMPLFWIQRVQYQNPQSTYDYRYLQPAFFSSIK